MAKKTREGWQIPDVIDPPESMSVTICIPKNVVHMKAFWGALWELTFWNKWMEDDAHSGTEVASVWRRYFLSWKRSMSDLPDCEDGMGNCCVDGQIITRVNPTTGRIEQSADNGATWQPAKNTLEDVIVRPVPPVTSGVAGTKCDAATNLSVQVDGWIDQVSNDFTTAQSLVEFATAVFEAILAAVLVILSAGVLTPIQALIIPMIGAALAAAWGAGRTAFDAYWTTEIKDQILCAAYCSIGEDGSFTDAGFAEFWSKVNTDLPPSPAKMLFMGFLSSVGVSGVNAMAASGMSADSDCADCDCETCDPTSFINGIWYQGNDLNNRGGTIIETGADYVIIQSQDRGDGQQEIGFYAKNHTRTCNIAFEWVGTPPNSALTYSNAAPNNADFENLVRNDLLSSPIPMCAFYRQIDSGSWQMKFTFL